MVSLKSLLYLVLLLLIVVDVSVRFMTNGQSENYTQAENEHVFELPVRMPAHLTASMLESYAELGIGYATEQDVNEAMSAKQQSQQSGMLEQLFAGDKRIRLSAVINKLPDPIYALISVTDSNNQKKLEKLVNGQVLFGYRVVDLSLNNLTLNSIETTKRSVTLNLYQKRSVSQNK
jgi:hypothetical protein